MKNLFLKFKQLSLSTKIALSFIIIILFVGIFSSVICVYPHNLPSGLSFESPNKEHIFGTDDLGIDLFSQICYGGKLSLIVGIITALLSGCIGAILGILSGYYGGTLDSIIMRIVDITTVLPDLPMMILLGAFFGPSITNIIIVLVLFSWATPTRIVRSKVMSIKKEAYIVVAKSYGANFYHLMMKHFLPQVLPILMITVIKLTSKAIISEASLSFLGLADPTSKSWGLILNHAINFKGIYFTNYWKWWVIAPLVAIISVVFSISIISRDLEKVCNKKL